MNSQEVVSLFRTQVNDLATPQLWSDTDAYGFLDDAQIEFCRQTGGLGDVSSDITLLTTAIGDNKVTLSPLILKIRDAWFVADGIKITPVNHTDMEKLGIRFDGATGRPKYLIFGMEEGKGNWHMVPTEAEDVQLVVDRLPLEEIVDGATPQELEIARQHHRHLTLWMRHLAYSVQDSEAYDKDKSERFKQEFTAYCFKAKLEKDRAKHKTRVVQYGGI